eukprot:m.329630 g.329630  ORF g.329630 m.329630 type:complete len:586 (-) comp27711_c0_seq10:516-2273(-)
MRGTRQKILALGVLTAFSIVFFSPARVLPKERTSTDWVDGVAPKRRQDAAAAAHAVRVARDGPAETGAPFKQPPIDGVALATAPKAMAAVLKANARALADLDAGRPLRVPTTPRFCMLLATTAKPQYADDLVLIAKTLFTAPNVHTFLMFNLDSISEPPRNVSEQLCTRLRGIGSNFECVWVPSHCTSHMCVASVFFRAMLQVGLTVLEKCDWVVKLDPDCLFVPRAAARFVQGLSPELPAFFGGGTGRVVAFNNKDSVTEAVARRLRVRDDPWPESAYHYEIAMPLTHWVASISTWRAMMMPELAGTQCRPPRELARSPTAKYSANDEVAVALCVWTARAASCITPMPYDFVRTGPAGGMKGFDKFSSPPTLRHIQKVLNYGKLECLVLIHVWPRNDYVAMYNKLNMLDHADRDCGPEGIGLVGRPIMIRYIRSMQEPRTRDTLRTLLVPGPLGQSKKNESCSGSVALLRHPLRGVPAHDVSDEDADAIATKPWLKPADTEGVCQCLAKLNDIRQPASWGTASASTKMRWRAFGCGSVVQVNRPDGPNSTVCQCLAEVPKSERAGALNESRRLRCSGMHSRIMQ